jgi:hypothetical protein
MGTGYSEDAKRVGLKSQAYLNLDFAPISVHAPETNKLYQFTKKSTLFEKRKIDQWEEENEIKEEQIPDLSRTANCLKTNSCNLVAQPFFFMRAR